MEHLTKYFASAILALTLLLAPAYPIQVIAQDAVVEEAPVEATAEGGVPPEAVKAPVVEEVPVVEESLVEEAPVEDTPQTVIETGDVVAETETESNVNVTEVDTAMESTEETTEESAQIPQNIDVTTENTATVDNTSTTTAETGDNTATSTEGDTLVDTGNAYASANVVSAVNFNLVESDGFLFLLNNFLQSLGHIDLRLISPFSTYNSTPSNPCGSSECNASTTSLSVETENDANISNVVIVRSSTGSNTASGENTSISTGNAYAGANLVNIANTNIVNSNYLVFAFNNFGGWNGDLIFPNSDFFSNFFTTPSGGNANVSNTNSADVENEVETSAETGGNEAEGEGAEIETGDAASGSNVKNIANTNIVNSPVFYVVFRIFGAWNGSVFNAPEGISWSETPSGLELFSSDDVTGDASSTPGSFGSIDVTTNNNADVKNKVKVFALTGENKAVGSTSTTSSESASVETGNAYAGANVLNIVNTNIVSSNWIVALINIFGDWNGNFSFGQPDLWVATEVQAPETLSSGSEAVFHTTVANRGDARASNIKFNGKFASELINFIDMNPGEEYLWDVGALDPGELKEFSYSARVVSDIPYGDTLMDHTFDVSALETDANPDDNSDRVSLLAHRDLPSSARVSYERVTRSTTYPNLLITKTHSAPIDGISASSTVDYTIVVKNEGGSAFEGTLYDVLKDENGKIVADNDWKLGEIFPNEEITITYTAIFDASTTPGVYTNSAWVEALGGNYPQGIALATDASSNTASSKVTVVGSVGEVLGASCGLYMDKFIRAGADNDVEQVKKLQIFLNKEMGTKLPITGFYGPLTYNATKAFQKKYADEILTRWGNLKGPTGIVYQTTIRWINKIECPDLALETPSLIDWSKNPNTPARHAIKEKSTKVETVSVKLEEKNNEEAKIQDAPVDLPTRRDKRESSSKLRKLLNNLVLSLKM